LGGTFAYAFSEGGGNRVWQGAVWLPGERFWGLCKKNNGLIIKRKKRTPGKSTASQKLTEKKKREVQNSKAQFHSQKSYASPTSLAKRRKSQRVKNTKKKVLSHFWGKGRSMLASGAPG